MSCIEELNLQFLEIDLKAKTSQDRGKKWIINKNGKLAYLFVVADGHGKNGHIISQSIIDHFDRLICSNIVNWFEDDLSLLITSQFLEIDRDIENSFGDIDGGSTLSFCLIRCNIDIWIANVGDSEIKLFDLEKNSGYLLSMNHTPNNIEEVKRIKRDFPLTFFEYDKFNKSYETNYMYEFKDDEILKLEPKDNFYFKNRNDEIACYLSRCYDGNNLKISVTRAIGDFSYKNKLGLISTPYVKRYKKIKKNQVIICASDGLWDSWKNNEIMEFLSNNNLKNFMEEHIKKSNLYFGENKDDTFIYIIF